MQIFYYIGIAVTLVLGGYVFCQTGRVLYHASGFFYFYVRGRLWLGVEPRPVWALCEGLAYGIETLNPYVTKCGWRGFPWGDWRGGWTIDWVDEPTIREMRRRVAEQQQGRERQ